MVCIYLVLAVVVFAEAAGTPTGRRGVAVHWASWLLLSYWRLGSQLEGWSSSEDHRPDTEPLSLLSHLAAEAEAEAESETSFSVGVNGLLNRPQTPQRRCNFATQSKGSAGQSSSSEHPSPYPTQTHYSQ